MKKALFVAAAFAALPLAVHAQERPLDPQPSFQDSAPVEYEAPRGPASGPVEFPEPSFQDYPDTLTAARTPERIVTGEAPRTSSAALPQPSFNG